MNLEKLNLVELDAQEVKETEGGFLPLVILAVTMVVHPVTAATALGVYNGYHSK